MMRAYIIICLRAFAFQFWSLNYLQNKLNKNYAHIGDNKYYTTAAGLFLFTYFPRIYSNRWRIILCMYAFLLYRRCAAIHSIYKIFDYGFQFNIFYNTLYMQYTRYNILSFSSRHIIVRIDDINGVQCPRIVSLYDEYNIILLF